MIGWIKQREHIKKKILTAIWLPTTNFGQFSSEQPDSPDVNHNVFTPYSTQSYREPRKEVGFVRLAERLVGFELESSNSKYKALTH